MVQQSQAKEDVEIRHTGKIPIHDISNSESHWANREKMGHGRYISVRGWPFLLGRPHWSS
ncbi:hypothetical protein ACSBR2_013395 [Camellia fascicularis]